MGNVICVLKIMKVKNMKYDKFTSKADIYDRYRPRYPREFIDFLYQYIGISNKSIVADIGAGTGILSEEFLKRGSSVVCVEPNIKMLEQAKNKLQQYKKVSFINSTAESTTIKDLSIDIITVGQAFHWFDKKRFLIECRRILVEEGTVILAWNVSNSDDPINIEISDINYKYGKNYNGYSKRDKENNDEYLDFFKGGKIESYIFENNLLLSREEFIGRFLSRSYAPNSDDNSYEKYINSLSNIFDSYSQNQMVKIKNNTKCILGKVK